MNCVAILSLIQDCWHHCGHPLWQINCVRRNQQWLWSEILNWQSENIMCRSLAVRMERVEKVTQCKLVLLLVQQIFFWFPNPFLRQTPVRRKCLAHYWPLLLLTEEAFFLWEGAVPHDCPVQVCQRTNSSHLARAGQANMSRSGLGTPRTSLHAALLPCLHFSHHVWKSTSASNPTLQGTDCCWILSTFLLIKFDCWNYVCCQSELKQYCCGSREF